MKGSEAARPTFSAAPSTPSSARLPVREATAPGASPATAGCGAGSTAVGVRDGATVGPGVVFVTTTGGDTS